MSFLKPLKIGITCYPSVGGSGILASSLGEELSGRNHEVHFISYEHPFRLPGNAPRIQFHPVSINDYGLFKYPDYTLPLSVKMAEICRIYHLDILHVHYAVPHATAAILARSMLSQEHQPAVVTTLHGTDTTLLGRDPGYGPAIKYALVHSDAVTTVSDFLARETRRIFNVDRSIEVVHNFFKPHPPQCSREQMRSTLGISQEVMILHSSNLRSPKRIDLLLQAVARIRPGDCFKLVILAGADFTPFREEVLRLGLGDRIIVREKVLNIEDYLQAADLGLYTSETESFCLSILEGMCFGCPSIATNVGGIPEVVEDRASGRLVPFGDIDTLTRTIEELIQDPVQRAALGRTARQQAQERFSAEVIVPRYEALYHRICRSGE